MGTPAARWLLVTTVLGSGMALLDGTVVNVALPSIARDLDADVAGLQWTVNAYMLTLSAFLLVGGSLGDRHGRRRIFTFGVAWFTAASLLCALAWSKEVLIAARALQGVGGALLTPGSLALIQSSFHPDDRGRAVGIWSGVSGLAAALGPVVGGWLVGSLGWRWVFLINLPVGALILLVARKVEERRSREDGGALDWPGALLAVVGLGGITFALIGAGSERTAGAGATWARALVGGAALMGFLVRERLAHHPMLPLGLFRSRNFSIANAVTLFAYAALNGLIFFLVLFLQVVAGRSPLQAGLVLLPTSVIMLALAPWAGSLTSRHGARLLMAGGCGLAAVATLWLSALGPSPSMMGEVLPAITLFSFGLVFVAIPVTVTVLAAASEQSAGIASGVNNAIARTAGLLAVAALPLAAGLAGRDALANLAASFPRALRICAVLFVIAAVLSLFLARKPEPDEPPGH